MENPIKIDDLGVFPIIFGNTQIDIQAWTDFQVQSFQPPGD